MAEEGFWKTAPGVVTAVAAIVTAIGGLIAVLVQTGIVKPGRQDASTTAQTTHAQVVTTTAAGDATTAVGVATTTGRAWRDVRATITASDGTQVTARAEAVRFCTSVGAGINLDDRQDIAFDEVARIEVVRSDVALSPGGRAVLRVTLTSGQTREGTITSGCDFFAQTDEGRYSLYPDRLRGIEFGW